MGTTQQTHTASSIMPSVLNASGSASASDGIFVRSLCDSFRIADNYVDGEFCNCLFASL